MDKFNKGDTVYVKKEAVHKYSKEGIKSDVGYAVESVYDNNGLLIKDSREVNNKKQYYWTNVKKNDLMTEKEWLDLNLSMTRDNRNDMSSLNSLFKKTRETNLKPNDTLYIKKESIHKYFKDGLKTDVGYKLLEIIPYSHANGYYCVIEVRKGIKAKGVKPDYAYVREDDVMSEEDWSKMNPNFSKGSNDPRFSDGTTVYFNGQNSFHDHHRPFILNQISPEHFRYKDEQGIYQKVSLRELENFFITEDEYKRKYQSAKNSHKNFKVGDNVYYLGDKIKRLEKGKSYEVEFYNPNTGIIKINGDIVPGDDFVSLEDYEKLAMDSNVEIENKTGNIKSDVNIKLDIFKDTQKSKLDWYRPYVTHENWFRAIIKLDAPKGAYLRIDVLKKKEEDQKWVMRIWYHRKKGEMKPSEYSVLTKEFEETQIIRSLVKIIEDQVDLMEWASI